MSIGKPRGIFTDLYELTMLRAYREAGLEDEATFSLFFRTLPEGRNYLLAAGLHDALAYLEELRFPEDDLEYLAGREEFDDTFVEWLDALTFEGEVRAMPEGTPVFPGEPILEVTGSLPAAQLAESWIMNQIHLQTVLASKAVRVMEAAGDATVVDFGLRRMHGTDAAMKAARAFRIAGVDATSNVPAGKRYGLPVTGTMAHSFVQAHDTEEEAFRAMVDVYPDTVLLIDTYDTLEGAGKVVELAREMGDDFRVRGVRLDSGDLGGLARKVRAILDDAGLENVRVFASGGLDEYEIRDLLEGGAPIDGFGVGTRMGVATDAPALDIAYKLTAYAGEGRLKLSSGKETLPGRKQVFRREEDGTATGDVIARADEDLEGRPLLVTVMEGGRRMRPEATDIEVARDRAREEIGRLPDRLRALDPAEPPYPVEVSQALASYRDDVAARAERIHSSTRGGETQGR